ncbi:hypothetical protein [Gallaecimonas pentaromativorans]|uniref:hypothetical protein n=1 Tax=Gallaecimonas pentaromativorans TaxID=584787 RepID=UPI003A8D1E62
MKMLTLMPVVLVMLTACASKPTKPLLMPSYTPPSAEQRAKLEEQRYEKYVSNCQETLNQVTWYFNLGKTENKAIQACLNELKEGKSEQDFHRAVIDKLPKSKLWLESAHWLEDRGLFRDAVKTRCADADPQEDKLANLPQVRYPIAALRDGKEGSATATAIYDKDGFFVKLVSASSVPKRIFERVMGTYMTQFVLCPKEKEHPFTFTAEFKIGKNTGE